MKIKWFDNPGTLEELKKQYHKLAVKHHPDIGGSEQDMKEINLEYEKLFEIVKAKHKNKEGEVYEKPTTETPAEFVDLVSKLIHMEGIAAEVIGSWLWITGNTKPYKEELKGLGFKWSRNKSAWYYHRGPYVKFSKTKHSLDDIRFMYGSIDIDLDQEGQKAERENGRVRIPAD